MEPFKTKINESLPIGFRRCTTCKKIRRYYDFVEFSLCFECHAAENGDEKMKSRLTTMEKTLLEYLAKINGRWATIDQLIQVVWSWPREEPEGADRALISHIYRLRKKVNSTGLIIESQSGLGYRLV